MCERKHAWKLHSSTCLNVKGGKKGTRLTLCQQMLFDCISHCLCVFEETRVTIISWEPCFWVFLDADSWHYCPTICCCRKSYKLQVKSLKILSTVTFHPKLTFGWKFTNSVQSWIPDFKPFLVSKICPWNFQFICLPSRSGIQSFLRQNKVLKRPIPLKWHFV